MKVIQTHNPQQGQADLLFYCPGCRTHHGIWTTSRNGKGAIWLFNDDYDKPTFKPSIHINQNGYVCHSYVTDGKIQYLNDCTHDLKGQTVELEDIL